MMLQTCSKLVRPSPFGAAPGPRPPTQASFAAPHAAHAGAGMTRSSSLEPCAAGLGRTASAQLLHRARSGSTRCGALASIAEHAGLGKDALLHLVSGRGPMQPPAALQLALGGGPRGRMHRPRAAAESCMHACARAGAGHGPVCVAGLV